VSGEELRAPMSRLPSSVAVVTVDANEQRLGLTVGSLVALSLEPPLVAIVVSRQVAMHELLHEAGRSAVSILTAEQEWLAQHFARGVPPIAMWHGIAVEAGASRAPVLAGALGWLECGLRDELPVGTTRCLWPKCR
jgi:flavin reductase (DIM6/NTAB) family NADH-FMN oxidoreductase RutF